MTFQVTVKNENGELVNDVWVVVNDLITGQMFSRTTNAGYADCATFPPSAVGNRVTIVVTDPFLRYTGLTHGDMYEITDHNQTVEVTLKPF